MTWLTFLPSVRVGGALPVSFDFSDLDAEGNECCRVSMQVPCVKTGEELTIHRVLVLPEWRAEAEAMWWVLECVRGMYRHEADEQVRFDGVRTFEPRGEHIQ